MITALEKTIILKLFYTDDGKTIVNIFDNEDFEPIDVEYGFPKTVINFDSEIPNRKLVILIYTKNVSDNNILEFEKYKISNTVRVYLEAFEGKHDGVVGYLN